MEYREGPRIGDRVWYLGEIPELQRPLKVTGVREGTGQVSVKPVENDEEWNGGWVVTWRDITYKEPQIPEEYLYG